MLRCSLPICLRITDKHCHLRQTAQRCWGGGSVCMCLSVWVKSACTSAYAYRYVCASVYVCVCVCVLAARLGVRGLVFLHLLRAEVLICTSLSADARKCDQAIRSTLCWKEEGSPLLSRRVLWKCHFPSACHLQAAAAAETKRREGGRHREEMAEALTCLDEKASNSGSTAIAVTLWLTQWVRCWVVGTMLGR